MSVAEKLERLARIVPGVGGYLDKEQSRKTDETIRLRLIEDLEALERKVESQQQRLTEAHALEGLAALGKLTAKFDKIAGQVRYASRGYRGFFDNYKLTQEKLEQLCDFDLGLFEMVEALRLEVDKLGAGPEAIGSVDAALDRFEAKFAERSAILVAE